MTSSVALGIQLLLNIYDTSDDDLLQYAVKAIPIINHIINDMELDTLETAHHQFDPLGYTYAVILKDGHFMIHTYPEYHSCYIDYFSTDDYDPANLIQYMQRAFHTNKVRYEVIKR